MPATRGAKRTHRSTPAQISYTLRTLRRRLWDAPADSLVKIGSLRVRITDGPNAYMQYKDVFVRGIYRFSCERPDPLIIDGGANMGFSAIAFKRDHPGARVISFEPDPAIASMLRENLDRNGAGDVTIVEAALGETNGSVTFDPDGSSAGHVGTGSMTVRMDRLSDHIHEPIDFLKLNIEGQELGVMRDLERANKLRLIKRVVLEYHGWPGGVQSLGEILTILDRAGMRYLVHDFDHETCGVTKPPFRLRPKAPWFCLVFAERP